MLDLLSGTLLFPRALEELKSELTAKGYKEETFDVAVSFGTDLGLLSKTVETHSGSVLLFNPHAFEGNAADAFKVLNALQPNERQAAVDALAFIKDNPGVPLPAGTDKKVVQTLIKVGIVDLFEDHDGCNFPGRVFRRGSVYWDVFDSTAGAPVSADLIDDAKLFLNSLRYGQFFSTPDRGKIIDPWWIVNALVRDGAIAVQKPVRAIGQDYPLALSRGIINVVESPRHPGRFSMEVVKADVAEAVRDVLQQNRFLPKETEISAQELERAGHFISPSAVRADLKLDKVLRRHHDEIVFGLRTLRRKQ